MLIIDPQATVEVMMRHCFALAAKSAEQGEYPYAAAIVRDGEIVAENTNKVGQDRDVTRHAELVAISLAQAALACTELSECTIFANMEPCAFCSYAVRETRIGKVVFAMHLPIMGGASHWNTLWARVARRKGLCARCAGISSGAAVARGRNARPSPSRRR